MKLHAITSEMCRSGQMCIHPRAFHLYADVGLILQFLADAVTDAERQNYMLCFLLDEAHVIIVNTKMRFVTSP